MDAWTSETAAQAEGLAFVPHWRVEYRPATLEELDSAAVLARAPALCLVEELAHTNAPGLEHAKRFEAVQHALAAGIDVSRPLTLSTSRASTTRSPSSRACAYARRSRTPSSPTS